MPNSFTDAEFEAAKAAARANKAGVALGGASGGDYYGGGSGGGGGDGGGGSSGGDWFRPFHVNNLPDDPDVRQEIKQRGPNRNNVDINAFFQGVAGPVDQRRAAQRNQHAMDMQMDPVAEIYHENRQRAAARRGHGSSSGSAASETADESTLFKLLRLFLISSLASCLVLYFSFSLLPSEGPGGSMTAIIWFIQVFSVFLLTSYVAATPKLFG